MKNKVVTTVIVLATVILAGVAIFTAVRLYQLREESVVPTAPESVPQAATQEEDMVPEACEPLVFTVTPRTPGLACTEKKAFGDDNRNEAGTYYTVTPIPSGSKLNPGDQFVYELVYKNTGTASVSGATITDTLPPDIEYVDSDTKCTHSAGVVTCNLGAVEPSGAGSVLIRVKIASNASGNFTNTATFEPAEGDSSNCSITLSVTEPDVPTTTPTAPPVTPTPTPASCNNTCSVDSDCKSGLDCVSGKCKNPSCTSETDCVCATPAPATPTPTSAPITQATPEPSLPDAGIPTPTLVGLAAGSLLLMFAILALAL
jgi:uncharacterized repeat protein (TIGR01451 family)